MIFVFNLIISKMNEFYITVSRNTVSCNEFIYKHNLALYHNRLSNCDENQASYQKINHE